MLFLPGLALAANDVTFPQQSTIRLDDGSTYTINTTSTFDSFTVNASTIVFTVSANSVIALVSSDKKSFGNSGTNDYTTVTTTCTATESTITVTVAANAPTTYTITITPSGTCGSTASTGGGGSPAPTTPTPTTTTTASDNLASDGQSVTLASTVSQNLTTSGGLVTLSNSNLSILVPSGGLSSSASLTVAPQANFAQPTAGYSAVGSQAYNVTALSTAGAKITQFAKPLTLTFNYTNDQITGLDENNLKVSYWKEETGEWVDVPTTIDLANNKAVATIDHLTKFILRAKSNTVPAGSLVKVSGKSTVYYIGHDNKRYPFPSDKIFFTWYENFNSVLTINQTELLNHNLGGNITTRPGTKLVQFVNLDNEGRIVVDDPKVYAVEPTGKIRWIKTAAIASALYGPTWEQKIIPTWNYLYTNYTLGTEISQATYPSGSLVKETATNNLYYISESKRRAVTTNGKTSNEFQDQYVNSAASLAAYPTDVSLNDYQNSISWTSGK